MPEQPPKKQLRKSEVQKLTEAQLKEWQDRNSQPGVLPCVPIIMISSLTGDKAGITINLNSRMPLKDVVQILKAASEQVQSTILKLEGN